MHISCRLVLTSMAIPLLLPCCAGLPGESPDHMRERMERQGQLVDRHQEKHQIQSEPADRGYDRWLNKAVGKPEEPQAWQLTY